MENNLSSQINKNIPENVISMYRIPGLKEVSYQKYLTSNDVFGKNNQEFVTNYDLVSKTKNEILASSGEEMVVLIQKALENNDIEIQRMGASLIKNAPVDRKEYLREITSQKIIEILNGSNIQIQRIAMNMIQFASEKNKDILNQLMVKVINDGISTNDIEVQRVVAKKISLVSVKDQEVLREVLYKNIINFLNTDDVTVQRLVSTIIKHAPKDKQEELKKLVAEKFELAKAQGKIREIVESLLYLKNKGKNDNSVLSRDIFSKTGSGMTLLLGEQFKNNLVIRHIEESCFIVWKNAYENHQAWSHSGFDYVPVEPIYSFNKDKFANIMNVASGVLDLNLEEWYAFSGDSFKESLDEQKNKIVSVLTEMGINHGHSNDANFCLRFYRDKDGNIDLNKVPRVYLIDFDKATNY